MGLEYPAPPVEEEKYYGILPVDFLLETVIQAGIEWFKEDPKAPELVFGYLKSPWLTKYGQAKIDEIANYIKQYEIRIVQHFSLIDTTVPCISIQLLDGAEMADRAGMADHQEMLDNMDAEDNVLGRTEVGYIPISDQIHIGIHSGETPDLVKYLYYLVVYILSSFKDELIRRGFMLTTFRATDISRMNEYLPENLYSRFINFSMFSIASFDKGTVPIVERILGVHVPPGSDATSEPGSDTEIDIETGLTLSGGN